MKFSTIKSNNRELIKGPIELFPEVFYDPRGYFYETWNSEKFNSTLGENIEFVQDNQSQSYKNVLRGMHYQINPKGQGKLVKVVQGKVLDVLVDLRSLSNTFGQWAAVELNDKKQNQLWIPIGFAHGFLTISDYAILQYKVTEFWDPKYERCLNWNDKKINITWNKFTSEQKDPFISQKDKKGSSLEELKYNNDLFL